MKGSAMAERHPLIIMAAGKGSRMKADADVPDWVREEAASRPKAMIRIGRERKPLLHHLIEQSVEEGMRDICVVIAEGDGITPPHFRNNPVAGAQLDFVVQRIPKGRAKPEGTAQAVQLALEAHPEWEGSSVTVANGDNLPPKGMLSTLRQDPACLPAFNGDHLGLPAGRVKAFAVIRQAGDGTLVAIEEKPDQAVIEAARWPDGTVRVSMNYFRMPWHSLLDAVRKVPMHPVRKERELPVAVSLWNAANPGILQVVPMNGAFLDLTHPRDVLTSGEALDAGGHTLRN